MKSWLKLVRTVARDSLWFTPAVLTVSAGILAVVLMAVEEQGLLWSGPAPWWVYQGDADAARTVLARITGSLMTVTGVVFSVTIVAVQLSSSQYTPRVLRDFSSDRGNQLVFGAFIGTFTYGFVVLRSIRAADPVSPEVLPRLAVTVSAILLLVCVGALIYFINHLTREMHVTALLDRVTHETLPNVHQLFPEHIGRADERRQEDPPSGSPSASILTNRAGYFRKVDEDKLFGAESRSPIFIKLEVKIGDYVLEGRKIASVWTDEKWTEELEQKLRAAFILGAERSPEQDVEFGIVEISDIAIKALSPSINDPTTAIRCIDRLAEILSVLGRREPPATERTRDGRITIQAQYTTFDRAIGVAFDDIRHFAAAVPSVAEHLLQILGAVRAIVPPERAEPLVQQGMALLHSARQQVENPRDLEEIARAASQLTEDGGSGVATR